MGTDDSSYTIGDWTPSEAEKVIIQRACAEATRALINRTFGEVHGDHLAAVVHAMGRESLMSVIEARMYEILGAWDTDDGDPNVPVPPAWWGDYELVMVRGDDGWHRRSYQKRSPFAVVK